jgi:hypothetical protein
MSSLKVALLMTVCEGEFELACSALDSVIRKFECDIHLFLIDDGSASEVGSQLLNKYSGLMHGLYCHRIPQSLGELQKRIYQLSWTDENVVLRQ